jgi:hypothetical protein
MAVVGQFDRPLGKAAECRRRVAPESDEGGSPRRYTRHNDS